ncbi:MAG: hypothetical protein CMJ46_04405 [Planctomyces sp.]|nr:hypothetical protein [Planctomyces sp.]
MAFDDIDLAGGLPPGCVFNLLWLGACVFGGLMITSKLDWHFGLGIGAGVGVWAATSLAWFLWDAGLIEREKEKRSDESEREEE